MQRHRNQHVGLVEQFAAGARHPAAHRRREIGAVLVFQRMHQRARDVVIAHRGAGARIGRRVGDRLHRQQVGAGIVDKGNAEPRAIGRRDERQLWPSIPRRRLRRRPARGRRRTSVGSAMSSASCAAVPTRRGTPQRAAQMGGDGAGWVMPRRPWVEASAALCGAQADSYRCELRIAARLTSRDALARARPVGEPGVACAIGQAFERRIAAKTGIRGARSADRPAASLLAQLEERTAMFALSIGSSPATGSASANTSEHPILQPRHRSERVLVRDRVPARGAEHRRFFARQIETGEFADHGVAAHPDS